MRLERDVILTDAQGRPIPRPERQDFPSGVEGTVAYMRAMHDWSDSVHEIANQAFVQGWKESARNR